MILAQRKLRDGPVLDVHDEGSPKTIEQETHMEDTSKAEEMELLHFDRVKDQMEC